ncbi:hypothetical protein, partial [Rhabdaerophilum sp.]|uniref:hypothetical protein n=1 Tax=Rhabdaerophilum sp. TaxID=2717341 RepID=UPI0038D4F4F6
MPAALLRFAPQSPRHSKDNTSPGAHCALSINPTGTVLRRYLEQCSAAVDIYADQGLLLICPRIACSLTRSFQGAMHAMPAGSTLNARISCRFLTGA